MTRRLPASASVLLVILGTLRLTRFVTQDWLGEWTIVRPVKAWAAKHETREIELRTEILRAQRHVEFDRAEHGPVRPDVSGVFVEVRDSWAGPLPVRHRKSRRAKSRRPVEPLPSPREEVLEHYDAHDPFTWQAKLTTGLDCPFCVGFWLGLFVIVGELLFGRIPVLGFLWHLALAALGLNYLVGHVSSRIDR